MSITRIKLQNFTVFNKLDIDLSPGLNVFIGANGTGKTHLMKVAYAACKTQSVWYNFNQHLVTTFSPCNYEIGRLIKQNHKNFAIDIYRDKLKLSMEFTSPGNELGVLDTYSANITGSKIWCENPIESAFLPDTKILQEATIRILEHSMSYEQKELSAKVSNLIGGEIGFNSYGIHLHNEDGSIEYTLMGDGVRELFSLWCLIRSGKISEGSVLFWDAPEKNISPKLLGELVEIFLEMQYMGVQIFLTTHSYVLLKEMDLRKKKDAEVLFHVLFRVRNTGLIKHLSTKEYYLIYPNVIQQAFANLYDRNIDALT